MPEAASDIIALGDAVVDVIADCDDAFLADHALVKGSMQILDAAAADRLYAAMGMARETSGGSAANSMAGAATMGASVRFVGQVADDQLGTIFAHDMRASGVAFDTPPLVGGPPTGRCLILVTPDAQRTMNTCPGASHELTEAALDPQTIRSARMLYLEGYLWGPERPRETMLRAIDIARDAGRQVAFTLSESVCTAGRREGFTRMIEDGGIDLLFANEEEALQLSGRTDFAAALADLSSRVATVVVTRGAAGAVAVENGQQVAVAAAPVAAEDIVDTTGAGDLFAAGFVTARCRNAPLLTCLETGAIAAAEVITHYGARPLADLKPRIAL